MSADLLRRLIEAGTPADLVAEVAMTLAQAEAAAKPDPTAERRRAWDREYRREKRAEEKRMSGGQGGCRVDNADIPLSPDKSPPDPQKLTPNPVCVTPAPTREAPPVEIALVPVEPSADPAADAVAAWNAMAADAGLSPIRKLTPERRGRIMARLSEHGSDAMTEAIAAVGRSRFCRGENDRRWRADFDFLLQPSRFLKLIEGSYNRADDHPGDPEITNSMVRAIASRRARRADAAGRGFGL